MTMDYTLADLDAMTIADAHALSFDERDRLLDLIIADGRHQSTDAVSHRIGLYCDYFEEDLVRMFKVRAVKVLCRGTTASGFDGVIVGDDEESQYRATLRHVQTTLEAAQTSYDRVVTLVVFLTDMRKVAPLQPGLPGVHPQPALPGRHRDHRTGRTPPAHRNRRVHRLPGPSLTCGGSPPLLGRVLYSPGTFGPGPDDSTGETQDNSINRRQPNGLTVGIQG